MKSIYELTVERHSELRRKLRNQELASRMQIFRTTEEMLACFDRFHGLNVAERTVACQKVG